jgi:hypothetical protein
MPDYPQIPFQELLDALLNVDKPFHPRYLYRLSDLPGEDLDRLEATWSQVPLWRRQALMEDIEELGESDFVLSFEAVGRLAVKDADPTVRLLGARALWEFEDFKLIPIFSDLLINDKSPDVRAAAATGLGKFIYLGEIEELPQKTLKKVEDLLLNLINGKDAPKVRCRALEALGFSSREEVVPLIKAAYTSGNKEWIASALFAMGRSANEKWTDQVVPMLQNKVPSIRAEAARAAGELEIKSVRQELFDLLEDDNEDVRAAAIWSLSQIGGEGVHDRLEEMQKNTQDAEEEDYLEAALDNLSFNEEVDLFTLHELDKDSEEGDLTDWEDGMIGEEDSEENDEDDEA